MNWILAVLMIWFVWSTFTKNDEVLDNYSQATIDRASENSGVSIGELTEDQLEEARIEEVDEATNNCISDCEGHKAGYEWAEENDISNESDCDGNSDSFNEGCVNYVEGGSGY